MSMDDELKRQNAPINLDIVKLLAIIDDIAQATGRHFAKLVLWNDGTGCIEDPDGVPIIRFYSLNRLSEKYIEWKATQLDGR